MFFLKHSLFSLFLQFIFWCSVYRYDSCHHSEVVIHWELIWRNQLLRTLLQLKYKLYNRRALYHKMRDMRLHFLLRSVWQDNNAYIYILLFSPNIKLSFQIESQNLQHLQATTSNSDSMALCVCARDFFFIFFCWKQCNVTFSAERYIYKFNMCITAL